MDRVCDIAIRWTEDAPLVFLAMACPDPGRDEEGDGDDGRGRPDGRGARVIALDGTETRKFLRRLHQNAEDYSEA